jgi:5-methylcytosine-specific restriction endonuclease McrA
MAAKRRGGRSRRGKGSAYAATPRLTLTSVPTGRAAYNDTRQWLLEQHGPVCAYCEKTVPVRSITLDHVTPRRGQTAYDRRDNLVLCCKACNSAKMDKPILAFLLGNRSRVVAMYKYGRHLSHQLVEMINDLLPEADRPPLPVRPAVAAKPAKRRLTAREVFGDLGDESPYLDESPRRHAPTAATRGRRPRGGGRGGSHAAPVAAARPVAHAAPPAAAAAPKKRRSRRGGRGRKKTV